MTADTSLKTHIRGLQNWGHFFKRHALDPVLAGQIGVMQLGVVQLGVAVEIRVRITGLIKGLFTGLITGLFIVLIIGRTHCGSRFGSVGWAAYRALVYRLGGINRAGQGTKTL
jgi:hypothetical protein